MVKIALFEIYNSIRPQIRSIPQHERVLESRKENSREPPVYIGRVLHVGISFSFGLAKRDIIEYLRITPAQYDQYLCMYRNAVTHSKKTSFEISVISKTVLSINFLKVHYGHEITLTSIYNKLIEV